MRNAKKEKEDLRLAVTVIDSCQCGHTHMRLIALSFQLNQLDSYLAGA